MVGVVKSVLGAFLKTVNERLDLMHLSVGKAQHGFTSHGIDVINVLLSTDPLSSNKVETLVFVSHTVRIDSRELFQVTEGTD